MFHGIKKKKKIRHDSKKTNFNLNNSDFALQNRVHLADELTFLGMSLTIVDRSDQNHMEKKKVNPVSDAPP